MLFNHRDIKKRISEKKEQRYEGWKRETKQGDEEFRSPFVSAPSSALITPPHLYPNVRILSRHTHFVTSARIYISIFYIKRIFACELYVLSSLRGKCRFLLKYEARFLCTFTLHFPLWILARFLKCFTDSLAFFFRIIWCIFKPSDCCLLVFKHHTLFLLSATPINLLSIQVFYLSITHFFLFKRYIRNDTYFPPSNMLFYVKH